MKVYLLQYGALVEMQFGIFDSLCVVILYACYTHVEVCVYPFGDSAIDCIKHFFKYKYSFVQFF